MRISGVIVALVLILVVVGLFLPRNFRVERAVVINAKPQVIFPLIGDLKNWSQWGVWYERDPKMTVTYSTVTTGVGAISEWTSKTEGHGKATITKVQAPLNLIYQLDFPEFGMTSTGSFVLIPDDNGTTKVIMGDEGVLSGNPLVRWMGVFMDNLVGPDFEAGLAKLKKVSEKS